MVWQDVVIAVCQLAFIPAMIPTIVGKDKPAFATNLMNLVIVTIIATCFATLQLWFAFGSAVPIAVIWLILTIQTRKR
jgi:hypothetical protein